MDLQILNMEDEFNPERIDIVLENTATINKPAIALWTSSIIKEDGLITSGWLEWCKRNQSKYSNIKIKKNTYAFTPKDNLKVYTIDSVEDYADEELSKFEYHNPFKFMIKDGDDNSEFYRASRYIYNNIDYQAMADKGYDGIHFTMNAVMIGHTFGCDYNMELYSIDCESTVWLTKNWWKDYKLLRKETVKYGIQ